VVDESIERLSEEIGLSFKTRAKRFATVSVIIKVILVLFSATATAMHFYVAEKWTNANYVGIGASIIVLLCGVLLLTLEKDSSQELELARRAVEEARSVKLAADTALDEISEYEIFQRRANELYLAMKSMKDAVENSLLLPERTNAEIIESILDAASRSLKIACGFQLENHYTFVVYEARCTTQAGREQWHLHPVAGDRSIKCDLKNARIWPMGVGVGGYCFSSGMEVVVPDMNAPNLGSGFAYPRKPDDDRLYRSIASVPIRVGAGNEIWGVVVATSDSPHHFSLDNDPGVQTVEGVRAFAGMVALAIQSRLALQMSSRASATAPREEAGAPNEKDSIELSEVNEGR
jgi:hypothetical protein